MKAYLLHVAISGDAFIQSLLRFGVIGVTVSSRAGTAKAHGHLWGCWLCGALDRLAWLGFGPRHCEEAIINDRLRAYAVLKELEGY